MFNNVFNAKLVTVNLGSAKRLDLLTLKYINTPLQPFRVKAVAGRFGLSYWLDIHPLWVGNKTTHRQDNSPTRFLRQFADRF